MYGDWEKDIIIDPEVRFDLPLATFSATYAAFDRTWNASVPRPNWCSMRTTIISSSRFRPIRTIISLVSSNARAMLERKPTRIRPSVQPRPAKSHIKYAFRLRKTSRFDSSLSLKDTRGRVTRTVLSGSGLLKATEDNDDDANDQTDSPKNDFWNLSNDEYYNPRLVDSVGKNLGSLNLQVRISSDLSLPLHLLSACNTSRGALHPALSHTSDGNEATALSSTDDQKSAARKAQARRVPPGAIHAKTLRNTSRCKCTRLLAKPI